MVKNLSISAGDIRNTGLIPAWRISPEEGKGNPFQYSFLENPMNRGACWATVHGVAKSWTLNTYINIHISPSRRLFTFLLLFLMQYYLSKQRILSELNLIRIYVNKDLRLL